MNILADLKPETWPEMTLVLVLAGGLSLSGWFARGRYEREKRRRRNALPYGMHRP